MVVSLLCGLSATGMQQDPLKLLAAQLERLPAEVSLEVARYYVYPIYQLRYLMGHPNGDKGITSQEAVEKVRRFYERHPHCKKNNPLVTLILLGHIVDNFMIFRLAQFDQIIAGVQKPELMPVFADPAMKTWIAAQQKKFAQEHELFRCDHYQTRNSTEEMKKLIMLGIDVNARNCFDGRTPLMLACKEGNLLLVDCLLKAGADVTLEDVEGKTALMHLQALGNNLTYEAYDDIYQLLRQAQLEVKQKKLR